MYTLPIDPAQIDKGPEIVGTGNEDKGLLRIFFLEIGHGVNRVGWLGQVKFNVRCPEPWIVFYRDVNHGQPVIIGEEGGFFLQRILRRNDKPYLADIRVFDHVIGDHQVAAVDRVE